MEILFIIIIIVIIMYYIFVRRTKQLYKAIDDINSGKENLIVIHQSLKQIIKTIQSQSLKIVENNEDMLFFQYKDIDYIVSQHKKDSVIVVLKVNVKLIDEFKNSIIQKNKKFNKIVKALFFTCWLVFFSTTIYYIVLWYSYDFTFNINKYDGWTRNEVIIFIVAFLITVCVPLIIKILSLIIQKGLVGKVFAKTIKLIVILYIVTSIFYLLIMISLFFMNLSQTLGNQGYLNDGINSLITICLIVFLFVIVVKVLISISFFIWKLSPDLIFAYIIKVLKSSKKDINDSIDRSKPIIKTLNYEYEEAIQESKIFYENTKKKSKQIFQKIKNECIDTEETNNIKKLSEYIISKGWTKNLNNSISFSETLIVNMGYKDAYNYIKNTSNDYFDTYTLLYNIMQKNDTKSIKLDKNDINTVYVLKNGFLNILTETSKKENDIVRITFSWEPFKEIIKDEINKLDIKYDNDTLDIVAEKLLKYMCHLIVRDNIKF